MSLTTRVRVLRVDLLCPLLSYLLLLSSLAPFASRAASAVVTAAATPGAGVVTTAAQAAPARAGELLVRFREGVAEGLKGAAVSSRGGRVKAKLRG
ncbi:MAG TPA: hypothetical protein VGV38_20740, partial [Pyrinomonadaceae bacterium]|nr:hypothetical protein [Pyrinomonadaceae bacterium]